MWWIVGIIVIAVIIIMIKWANREVRTNYRPAGSLSSSINESDQDDSTSSQDEAEDSGSGICGLCGASIDKNPVGPCPYCGGEKR